MAQCKFGVVRKGDGNRSITISRPVGRNRVIFFEDATRMTYDQSEAHGGAKMTVGKSNNLYTVKIGNQRFDIPEAGVMGEKAEPMVQLELSILCAFDSFWPPLVRFGCAVSSSAREGLAVKQAGKFCCRG
jgi:hypothetical protein